jgi:hypothetical protein
MFSNVGLSGRAVAKFNWKAVFDGRVGSCRKHRNARSLGKGRSQMHLQVD